MSNDRQQSLRVTGTVVSGVDGSGLGGLTVEAWPGGRAEEPLAAAATDDKGRFSFEFAPTLPPRPQAPPAKAARTARPGVPEADVTAAEPREVFFRVYAGPRLLASTEKGARWRSDAPSQVTISVDLPGAREAVAYTDEFTVRGRVATLDGRPVAGRRVVVAEPGTDEPVGVALTDDRGYYTIRYTRADLSNPARGEADITVTVADDRGAVSAASPLILGALPEEVVNLAVGDGTFKGRSEFEVLADRLDPLLRGVDADRLTEPQAARLAAQTGVAPDQVHLYVAATRQAAARRTEPAVLYGLFRSGLPASVPALAVHSPDVLTERLAAAAALNLVPRLDAAAAAKAVGAITSGGGKELLDVEAPGAARAASLLDLAGLTAREKTAVLRAYSAGDTLSDDFWADLRSEASLSGPKTERVRRAFEFEALALGHAPLVEALVADAQIGSVRDLAGLGSTGFERLLSSQRIPAPAGMPGGTEKERRAAYATVLARLVEDAHPTPVLAAAWSADKTLDRDVADVLERNPDLDLTGEGVHAYLERNPGALRGVEDPDATALKLRALQNLTRAAPRFERFDTVKTLWAGGLRSAHDIKRMGQERFVEQFGDELGTARALSTYAVAQNIADLALVTLVKYAWDTNGTVPYAIPTTDLNVASNAGAQPTLAELFGSLDFCSCQHCRSVLGPAAYLVDLLLFLDGATAADGDTALEKLFQRRPDLGNIKLDCDNTNTPLPYIDLVNEVLENVVEQRTYTSQTHSGTTVYVADVEQTGERRADRLRAHPEHLNRAAYERLRTAVYPWVLPYDLWADEARTYLGQLGVDRHELMRTLRGPGAPSASDSDVLGEVLGMSPVQRGLVTTPATSATQQAQYWGVTSGSLAPAVRGVVDFLHRAGIDYATLEELLQCRAVNPPGGASPVQISFAEDDPCALESAELTNLTAAKLDRIHRFLRLARALAMGPLELDRAMAALGSTALDDSLLERLAVCRLAAARLGVELPAVLSWCAVLLDTTDYHDQPSPYRERFLSQGVGDLDQTVRDVLEPDASGSELSATDQSMTDAPYESVVLAAARLRTEDLARIVAEDLDDDDTLDLAHLSHVVRVADFARATRLSVADVYLLRRLTGLQPFALPGTAADPRDVVRFLDALDDVRASNLALPQLAYLLAHDTGLPGSGELLPRAIEQRVTDVRDGAAAVAAAHQLPDEGREDALLARLGTVLGGEEDVAVAEKIVLGRSPLPDDEQEAFVDGHFAAFLDAADAKAKLVGDSATLGDDAAARVTYVLEPLLAYLLPREGRRYLEQKVGETLSLAAPVTAALLDGVVEPDAPGRPATAVLLDEAFLATTGTVTAETAPAQWAVYERMSKAAALLAGVKAAAADQALAVARGDDLGWLDLGALPLAPMAQGPALTEAFARFRAFVQVLRAAPRFLTTGATLADLLDVTTAAATTAEVLDAVAASTAWPREDVETLVDGYGYGLGDLRQTAWLVRLHHAFRMLARLGVRAAQAWSWNTPAVDFAQANQMKLAARSKYSDPEWLALAPDLRDPLRERQRDALLAHVMSRKQLRAADDVYEHYLIDPEMSACMDTSRIRQAISSVQLFVQRVLLGIEPELEFTSADAAQWKWRKNYRVWEANRKVFLWPENWLYPELRDDKSPLFADLEDELSQADIDNDSAERAFMSYLKRLDEIAHLEVMGSYSDDEAGLLHVVARTRSRPHRYFYRRRVGSAYWTAWEPVDADIEADHVIPVVHNRRLFLFWPQFIDKAYQPTGSSMSVQKSQSTVTPADPYRYYEILVHWTQLRDGKWQEARASRVGWNTGAHKTLPEPDQYYFFTEHTSGGDLVLRCRTLPHTTMDTSLLTLLGYNDVTDDVDLYWYSDSWESFLFFFRNWQLHKLLGSSDNRFQAFHHPGRSSTLELLTAGTVDDYGTLTPSTKRTATVLNTAPGGYHVLLPHQLPTYRSDAPFFFSDDQRVLFVETEDRYDTFWRLWVDVAFSPAATTYLEVDSAKVFDRIHELAQQPQLVLQTWPQSEAFVESGTPYFVGTAASQHVVDHRAERFTTLASRVHEGVTEGLVEGLAASADVQLAARVDVDFDLAAARSTSIHDALSVHQLKEIEKAWDFYDVIGGLGDRLWVGKRYRFRRFSHPHVGLMIRQLNRHGVEGLLAPKAAHGPVGVALQRQQARTVFFPDYGPNASVVDPDHPVDDFDFSFGGAYSQYNWELFFHAPLHIAERLSQNQRFEEAQRWFHYIFDPTETDGPAPKRFWKIKPFYDFDEATSIAKLLELLNSGDEELAAQVAAWEDDPFNPHLVARMRVVAYMRTVVMRYLDNLIAWGDHLFRQDTMESLNEATQIYVLAAQILGRRPVRVPRTDVTARTFNELLPTLDDFANARVFTESTLPWITTHAETPGSGGTAVLDTLFFCIPENEKLLGYWDVVADRLFKLRNCMNIEGVVRRLALFEPPIDPGLLVKARAGGADISSLLADLNAPLPPYRFRHMLARANEFAADVRALGSALLQALERRDEAALATLRATHQVDLGRDVREVKVKAVDEARALKTALEKRREQAGIRQTHYDDLDFMNPLEIAGMAVHGAALIPQGIGTVGEIMAAAFALLPTFQIGASGVGGSPHVTVLWGSQNIASSNAHMNSFFFQLSGLLHGIGSIIDTLAAYQRRQEEWDLQATLAAKEQEEVTEQITAAQARIDMASADLRTQDNQIARLQEEADFLATRFTNRDLYHWSATQLSTLYFQSYQLAYDLAKKAEQCYRHELGIRDTNFVQFGYWDSLKKGLLAGERLQKDLRRMEASYLERHRREPELTKHVSLAQLDPLALLRLKETGTAEFTIPELLFDLDHPGHYARRLKSVSLSVPCVAGPYTGVTAKLTLLSNVTRTSTSTAGGYAYQGLADSRFAHDLVGVKSVSTSSAQRDAGLFEVDFGDDRYLPFEGAGAVGRWRIELPTEFRQFDYDTISDVILHLSYTAKDAGSTLRSAAEAELRASLNKLADVLADSETGLLRIVSAAGEFGNDWHRFLNPPADADEQVLEFTLSKRLFPFMLADRRLDVSEIVVGLLVDDPDAYDAGGSVKLALAQPGGDPEVLQAQTSPLLAGQPGAVADAAFSVDGDAVTVSVTVATADLAAVADDLVTERDGKRRLHPDAVKDLVLALRYTVAS